ncbi:MAG: hypothetical protein QM778_27730 [Myxococcales bacterium]
MLNGYSGVCAPDAPGSVPFTYRAGGCHQPVSPEWKSAVCCAGLVGADCTSAPYDKLRKPGETCSHHADCEGGLVCKPDALGFGLCVCPHVEPQQLSELPDCRQTWFGGQEPTPAMAPGSCKPAGAPGWSVESLPAGMGNQLLAAVTYSGDTWLVTRREENQIRVTYGHDQQWYSRDVGTYDVKALDAAVIGNGLYIALIADGQLIYVAATGVDSWSTRVLSEPEQQLAPMVKIIAGSEQRPVVLAAEQDAESDFSSVFALVQKVGAGAPTWDKIPEIASVKDLVSFDARGGAARLHTLVEANHEIKHRLSVNSVSIDGSAGGSTYAGYGAGFIKESWDTLYWLSVSQSQNGNAQIVLDLLEGGDSVRRPIYTNPTNYPNALSTPHGASTTEGKLYTAFRGPVDPLRAGIFLLEGNTEQASVTRLIDEPFEPLLVVNKPWQAEEEPHVFYEARRSSTDDPSVLVSDIRHLFKGSCRYERNGQCAAAIQGDLPPNPTLTMIHDRPLFDQWRDLDCGKVADYPLCGVGHFDDSISFNCDVCLTPVDATEGVCTPFSHFSTCLDSVLSMSDGLCGACAPFEAKARACCAGLAGFDCKAWPYHHEAKRGQDCATHEDCEPGLICRTVSPFLARCTCPEEDGSGFGSPYCAELAKEDGKCRPAKLAGYVYEELPSPPGQFVAGSPAASVDKVYVYVGPSAQLFTRESGAWTARDMQHTISDGTLAVDSQGRLHIVSTNGYWVSYERLDPDGTLQARALVSVDLDNIPDTDWRHPVIALRDDDTPVVLIKDDVTNSVRVLLSAGDPIGDDWLTGELFVAAKYVENLAAHVDAEGDLYTFVSEVHGETTLIRLSGEQLQTATLGSVDVGAAVSDEAGIEEWVSLSVQDDAVSLHEIFENDATRLIDIPASDMWTPPRALRRPNGDLVLSYQSIIDDEGIMLYEETASGKKKRELLDQSFRNAMLTDPAGKLHFIVDMGMFPSSQLFEDLGVRHYYEGSCPAP